MVDQELVTEDMVVVAGYVALFGKSNTKGDVVTPETVIRAPSWFQGELEKDERGVKVTISVPRSELGGSEVEDLREQVSSLMEQCQAPLTAGEIHILRDVLAKVKAELGDRVSIVAGLALVEKLDRFLNPGLFDKKAESAE
jgi:hypothetical protein